MASVKAVTHRDGTVVYRVRYRAGGRNPVSETFYDAASAQRFADLVDRIGGAAARELKFELAGRLRDEIADLRKELRGMKEAGL